MSRISTLSFSVVVSVFQQREDEPEEVQNIQIQCNRGHDLIFNTEFLHDELSVNDYVAAEDQCTQSRINHMKARGLGWEEHEDKAHGYEHPQANAQDSLITGKVILGLECKGGQAYKK